jgi:hypothetical protein
MHLTSGLALRLAGRSQSGGTLPVSWLLEMSSQEKPGGSRHDAGMLPEYLLLSSVSD